MVGLIGVITIIIALMNRLVAKHTDLVVMFAGGLADPLAVIEIIYGGSQILFGDRRDAAQIVDHELQNLTGFYHR